MAHALFFTHLACNHFKLFNDLPFVRLTSRDNAVGKNLVGDESVGVEVRPKGTLAADTGLTSNDFSVDDDKFDLDSSTTGFASILEAIEDIQRERLHSLSHSCWVI